MKRGPSNPYPPEMREGVRRLKAQGLSDRVVASTLGITPSTVYRWMHPEAENRYRERRRHMTNVTYVGVCKGENCNALTSYQWHNPNRYADLCLSCAAKQAGVKKRLSGPVIRGVFDLFPENGETLLFADIKEQSGIGPSRLSALLRRLISYGYIERVSLGEYRRVLDE